MKKKQRELFNSLLELPEVTHCNYQKDIRQLRSYYERITMYFPNNDEKLYNQITKKIIKLQSVIPNQILIKQLRIIQSECDKLRNNQEREQLADFHAAAYDPSGWCGVDYEY